MTTPARWLTFLLGAVLFASSVPAADAPVFPAESFAVEMRRQAAAAVEKARQRVDTANADLRQARAALDGALRNHQAEAVQVAREAVQVSEDERRQADRLLALAKKRLADREAVEAGLRAARSRGKADDSFAVPVDGDVRRKRPDGTTIADPSEPLRPGQTVETGTDGRARLFLRGANVDVQLRESSSLTISEDSESGIELLLKEGFVRFRAVLVHWLKPRFEVRTPTAVLAVRGTEYAIDIRDGREVLSVYKGVVVATPALGGEPVPVKAGEQLSWGRSLPWPAPVTFDPALGGGGVK